MARISDKLLDEFIEISASKGIQYKDRAEPYTAASNVVDLVSLLLKIDREEKLREQRLEKEPNGFAMTAHGRTCILCNNSLMDEEMWYDKWGMKCMDCQALLNKKVIPGYIFKYEGSYITSSKLGWKYNIRYQTLKKLIRQGKLKARVLKNGTLVFLKKENSDWQKIISQEKGYKES